MAAVETVRPQGDRVANATHDLYRQFGRQIYAYCFHKLRSREEAEDAVQTTFMNAFRALQRGTSTQYEQAWLYKIAQNVCFERQSSSSRRRLHEAPNDFEVLQEVVPASDGGDSLELIGIEEALEGMPENQRRAILLREWQGLSYREIGEELGLSQAAVEMLIFRARRALAGALEQPDEARAKRRRVGRGITVGGLLSALKTLFGGGAAIKAVAAAAAAVVVVGESAQHTVVQQHAQARKPHGAAPAAVAQRGSRAAAGLAARPVTAAAPAARAPRVAGVAHAAAVEQASPSRHADTGRVRTDAERPDAESTPPQASVVAAPAPAPAVTVPAPAPSAPSVPVVQVAPPAAPPAPAAAPPAPALAPVPEPTLPTLAAQPTPPGNGNGNGNAWGHEKKDTPPVATTTVTDPAPPAGQGNGNSNGNGNGPTKDSVDPPAVSTTATATAPQPPADHGGGNGHGNNKP